ncbi:hypothetical protein [Leptolyngbya sp. FACHB-711]|uniref:hypothetical protein n=1 Tax=Leptolyngbya sp. FACHB-711 TaxID=2692813 RepID=UPI0016895E8C|nr:hypothetical protein [Leptolyngbya sp. FACHB-711]MBD2028131.1 hypothetical protein [Leptolyngbya sp. FACHB-711]
MLKKIHEVTDVKLATLESFPPKLLITASGTVPTGGWSEKGELIEYIYITPPVDGYYEFDFVGESPSPDVIVTQGLKPIVATFVLNSIPEDLKGIKVYASCSSKKEAYNDSPTLALEIIRVGN